MAKLLYPLLTSATCGMPGRQQPASVSVFYIGLHASAVTFRKCVRTFGPKSLTLGMTSASDETEIH